MPQMLLFQPQQESSIMHSHEKGAELEDTIVSLLEEIDPQACRSVGSGNSKFKGDIYNKIGLRIECKYRAIENCCVNRKWWNKLIKELNVYNQEIPILVLQNKHDEIFACLDIKDLIELLKIKYNKERDNNA